MSNMVVCLSVRKKLVICLHLYEGSFTVNISRKKAYCEYFPVYSSNCCKSYYHTISHAGPSSHSLLAHLAKGHVSFCHQVFSVVYR